MPIHPTALIDPSLALPPDAEVGAYSVLDEDVILSPRVRIGPFCHLYPGTRLDEDVRLWDGAVIGGAPQDLKYKGEPTGVHIGAGTQIREYATVNRGTRASGLTRVGAGCLIMAYSHVAHDCALGDRAILANGVQMGGHVDIGEGAVVSGMTGIHQFVTIGPGAFIGGGLRVDKDVLPFSKALGEPLRFAGVNAMGLHKLGFRPAAHILAKAAFRSLSSGGRDALERWVAGEAAAEVTFPLRGGGASGAPGGDEAAQRADRERLIAVLKDFLARQSRSLLVRPASERIREAE